MRILVVSPFQPNPTADHGGGVYLGTFVDALQRHAEVAVACFRYSDEAPAMPGVRTYSVPRLRNPDMNSGQLRRQQLRMLRDWGLRGQPLEAAKHRSPEFAAILRSAVDEFQPDIALVEFAVMAQYLEDLQGVKTVFTDHEAGESLPARFGPLNLGRARDRYLWRRYVRRHYPRSDLCQAVNAADAATLEALTQHPVHVRPAFVRVPEMSVEPGGTDPVMLFFGNYNHHPNPEAACRFAEEVLPQVRARMPASELWIAGPKITRAVEALGGRPGVKVLGYVDDLAAVLRGARCLVAPMFSGSGTRIKVAVAMAHGLPVVANQLGLQGIEAPPAAVALGESADALADATMRFLDDPRAAAEAGAAARQFIIDTMSGEQLVQRQLDRFAAL